MFENLGSTIGSLKQLGVSSALNPAPSGVRIRGKRNKPLLTRRKAQTSMLLATWACTLKGGTLTATKEVKKLYQVHNPSSEIATV
jgi:hypothetical protein